MNKPHKNNRHVRVLLNQKCCSALCIAAWGSHETIGCEAVASSVAETNSVEKFYIED